MFNVLRYSNDPTAIGLRSIKMLQSCGAVMFCVEERSTNRILIGPRTHLGVSGCISNLFPRFFNRSKQHSIFSRFKPGEIVVMLVIFQTYSHDNTFHGWTRFQSKTNESVSMLTRREELTNELFCYSVLHMRQVLERYMCISNKSKPASGRKKSDLSPLNLS